MDYVRGSYTVTMGRVCGGDGVRGDRWPAPLPDQGVDHGGHEAVAHTPRS